MNEFTVKIGPKQERRDGSYECPNCRAMPELRGFDRRRITLGMRECRNCGVTLLWVDDNDLPDPNVDVL